MSAHTPGPWVGGRKHKDCEVFYVERANTVTGYTDEIAVLYGQRGEEALANARLIAAAPDLLEALLDAVTQCESAAKLGATGPGFYEDLADTLRAAIAKATGDESDCPGHVASDADPKVCGHCGTHIDSLRPNGGAA